MRNLRAVLAAALALAFPASATVTGNQPPSVYACNGTTTTYTIAFPYLATSNVSAAVTTAGVAAPLSLATDYTVTPSTAPSVGTLKLVAGSRCPNGSTLTISRNTPLTQPTSFRTGPYSGSATEQAFDRIEMQLQQMSGTIANPVLPSALTNATSVTARGSTTPLQLQDWFASVLNVKAFNAKGDGATDDTAAIQAALNAAILIPGGVTLRIPSGTYKITNTLRLNRPVGITIQGDGKWATIIKWAGSAGIPEILLYNARETTLRDFYVQGNSSAAPSYGIEVRGDSTDPQLTFTPSYNVFERLQIAGPNAGAMDVGLGYTLAVGSVDQNNDQATMRDITSSATTTAGFYNQGNNGKSHRFFGCEFTGGKRGIWMAAGSFQSYGTVMLVHTEADYYVTGLSDGVLIDGGYSEQSNRLFWWAGANPGSNGYPVVIQGVKFANSALNADQNMIVFAESGPLILRGNFFGVSNIFGWLAPRVSVASFGSGNLTLEMVGNGFYTEGADVVFPVTYANGGAYDIKIAQNTYRAADSTLKKIDGVIVDTGTAFNILPPHNGWTIIKNRSTLGAATATLPPFVAYGFTVTVKDGKGDAAINNVTINPQGGQTIDGAATSVISTNWGSKRFRFIGGTSWVTEGVSNLLNKGAITLSGGTGTATVSVGATCTCTDQTAVAAVKCPPPVAGTLTATGTGSDVISYLCF